jgi:homoserine dehydrogenase
MQAVPLVLAGFGNVGRAFVRLTSEKKTMCRERYGLDLHLKAVLKTAGGFFGRTLPEWDEIVELPAAETTRHPAWQSGLGLADVFSRLEPGVLVEATPTDIQTGEPGLGHMIAALEKRWHVAAASKGALVLHFTELTALARKNGVGLKYGGATAAALPTLDVGLFALAGTEISRIEGILNGVTNHILTRMEGGVSFSDALRETQEKGIAEPDPSLDVDGWDTACKILLIANSVAGTSFRLSDVRRESIRSVTQDDMRKAGEKGRALKLLGRFAKENGASWAEAKLVSIDKTHPLFGVSGTNKGITFFTDTMGPITVMGGRSDPRGTAAAILKDIINIYRP